jgi:uncharacterized protein (TIGR02246 family)
VHLLAAALLALAVAGCSLGRGAREEPPAAPVGAAEDADAAYAEARRILQTRSFARLRESVNEAETQAIVAVLDAQIAAWNRGDLESFMEGYWRSPDLRFASGSTPVRGWAEALRRYRTSYPDRTDMGELTLSNLEINILAPDAATVFGQWRLAQASAAPAGLFTLVFRKIDGRWLIIHDHTSTGL